MMLMSLRLIIEDDEGVTTVVALGKDAVTIGRQQGNTVQLTEKNVSRRHARLVPDTDRWVLEDLGSYNGIKVNGELVAARLDLKEGDVIQIGDYHLALTEDVDKRTLNFESREAANDPQPQPQPMMISSSTDLPRVSPDDPMLMQSGPQGAISGANLLDSGQIPMPSYTSSGTYELDQPKRGPGVMIGLAVLGVAALGIAVFLWMGGPAVVFGEAPATANQAVASNDAEQAASAVVPAPKTPPAPTPAESPEEPSGVGNALANGSGDAEPAATPTAAGTEAEDGAPGEAETADDADPPGEDVVVAKTSTSRRARPKSRRPTAKKPAAPSASPPEPDEPEVDTEKLVEEAKLAQYKDPARAYSLAAEAYAAGSRTSQTIALMAACACKMKDAAKAKRAIAKLRGSDRDVMTKSCRDLGVEI